MPSPKPPNRKQPTTLEAVASLRKEVRELRAELQPLQELTEHLERIRYGLEWFMDVPPKNGDDLAGRRKKRRSTPEELVALHPSVYQAGRDAYAAKVPFVDCQYPERAGYKNAWQLG